MDYRELKLEIIKGVFNKALKDIIYSYIDEKYDCEELSIIASNNDELHYEFSELDIKNCEYEYDEEGYDELINTAYLYYWVSIRGNEIKIEVTH